MDNETIYFKKYLKYKQKYLELKYSKKNNIMKGGAGFPIKFTNGIDMFSVSGYSQLYKLQSILKKKEGKGWFIISKKISKIISTETYDEIYKNTIPVTNEEYKIIRELCKSLKILL